jgi:hypothetical protein
MQQSGDADEAAALVLAVQHFMAKGGCRRQVGAVRVLHRRGGRAAVAVRVGVAGGVPKRASRRLESALRGSASSASSTPSTSGSDASSSSNPAARRPSARVPADCSIRREAAVSTCGPARRSERASDGLNSRCSRQRGKEERAAGARDDRRCSRTGEVRASFRSNATFAATVG